MEREAEAAELLCQHSYVHPREVAVAPSAWSQLLDENLSSVKATFQGYANAAAPNHLSFLSWQFYKEEQNIICRFKRSQVEYFKPKQMFQTNPGGR